MLSDDEDEDQAARAPKSRDEDDASDGVAVKRRRLADQVGRTGSTPTLPIVSGTEDDGEDQAADVGCPIVLWTPFNDVVEYLTASARGHADSPARLTSRIEYVRRRLVRSHSYFLLVMVRVCYMANGQSCQEGTPPVFP